MLVEIMCSEFIDNGIPRGRISFRKGLNTVLGNGTDSVGKSTFLMIIDFVFGGTDYVLKLKNVQKKIGEHRICFAFRFNDEMYYFSRSSVDYNHIQKCDKDYNPLNNRKIKVKKYISFLQKYYGLDLPGLVFRKAVGLSCRVSGRATLNKNKPLHNGKNVTDRKAIEGVLQLANMYFDIEALTIKAKNAKEKYTTIKNARKYRYLPCAKNINEYYMNERRIDELLSVKNELAEKSYKGLTDLDSLNAQRIFELKFKLSKLNRESNRLSAQLRAMGADQEINKSGFKRKYDELLSFFPNTDIARIEEIETFHKRLTGILKKEFLAEETRIYSILSAIGTEIKNTEAQIEEIAGTTDLSKAVLDEYAKVDKEQSTLQKSNHYFEREHELSSDSKRYNAELYELIANRTQFLEEMINNGMEQINESIYCDSLFVPKLNIIDPAHYTFSVPEYSGFTNQYYGLIVFDLTLLKLTRLPLVVHDSLLFESLDNHIIEKILEIYNESSKQIFVAIDNSDSYTTRIQEILEDTKVLQLSSGEGALFGQTWNSK